MGIILTCTCGGKGKLTSRFRYDRGDCEIIISCDDCSAAKVINMTDGGSL